MHRLFLIFEFNLIFAGSYYCQSSHFFQSSVSFQLMLNEFINLHFWPSSFISILIMLLIIELLAQRLAFKIVLGLNYYLSILFSLQIIGCGLQDILQIEVNIRSLGCLPWAFSSSWPSFRRPIIDFRCQKQTLKYDLSLPPCNAFDFNLALFCHIQD